MPRIVKILIVVVIAIPVLGIGAAYVAAHLGQQRMAGHEASAIGSLRAVISAQLTHAAMCRGAYAPTLERLASLGYLTPALGSDPAQQNGYVIALEKADGAEAVASDTPDCATSVDTFVATAVPVEPGTTGGRFFRADHTGAIVQATSTLFADARPLE